uniref:Fidgetin like 2 n=1 Tax=Myotis myotis TaxID=51298 RepID=A0A7J7Z429_MYOMY|nr:fidgetin like 2 [Myotis myotis]
MPSSVEDALDTGTRPASQPVARAAPGRLLHHPVASPQVGAAPWGSPALPLRLGTRRHLRPHGLQPPQALRREVLGGPGLALRAPHPGRLRRCLSQRRQGGPRALARARDTLPLGLAPRRPPGNQVGQWGRLRGPRGLPGFSREPA